MATGAPATAASAVGGPPHPATVVVAAGILEVMDATSGKVVRRLAAGVSGDEVAVTPDGTRVFFESGGGCQHLIDEVGVGGGAVRVVTVGSLPALSPDGTELAVARQPYVTADASVCQGYDLTPAGYAVVVRNLASGVERTLAAPPEAVATGVSLPVDHLSWSGDGQQLAVSVSGGAGFVHWAVYLVAWQVDSYYAGGGETMVPVAGPSGSYYEEAVFAHGGQLFADRQCCAGYPRRVVSNVASLVAPDGALVTTIATGQPGVDDTSLAVDSSGQWFLFVAGSELTICGPGIAPTALAAGVKAAAWLP